MENYGDREIRRLKAGYVLFAGLFTAVFTGSLFWERYVCMRRVGKALETLYGTRDRVMFSSLTAGTDLTVPLVSILCFLLLLMISYFYITGCISGFVKELKALSLSMEQIMAGKRPALDRWKEGILSSFANQAELLCRRNSHMIAMVREEKEAINKFTENLVHQMKTPLTALRLNLDLLETKLDPLPEKAAARFADCQEQCSRLKRNIDELLTSSRLASGKLAFLPAPANMEFLVESVKEELAPILEEKRIKLEFKKESSRPLYCDSGWMKTALSNLVKNSAEAMEDGTISVRYFEEDPWLLLELTDEGGGVSPEEAPHLFERFYTGKEETGGTGLGLSIAKEVVEAAHGTVCAMPVPGKAGRPAGTCFLLRFRILSGAEAYGS